MNKRPMSQREMNDRLAKRIALAALCVGSAYGCAVSNAEGVDHDAASAEGPGGVAPAEIGTVGPTPTVTVGPTLPPLDFVYHGTIDLQPGLNPSTTVSDDDKNSPYRVKVKDTLGLNGTVSVGMSMGTTATPNSALCAQYRFEFTVEGYEAATGTWALLASKTKTGAYSAGSGEFPTPSCGLSQSVSITGSTYSSLRVFAKGHRNVTINGVTTQVKQNMNVSAGGTNPVPDPGRRLRVTGIALNASKTGATATVKNDGPQTATGVRATLSGSYEYCPPAQPGQSYYCENNGEPTEGYFANPSVNPVDNPVWPHRQAKRCNITSNLDTSPSTIGDDQTVTYAWPTSIVSNDAGCEPCTPGNGRCYRIVLEVKTDSIDETDPWDTWDKASDLEVFPGVVD